jgi:hypothetical protein
MSKNLRRRCAQLARSLWRWQHATRFPTIYQAREFRLDGGLMSYSASFVDAFRLRGRYTAPMDVKSFERKLALRRR